MTIGTEAVPGSPIRQKDPSSGRNRQAPACQLLLSGKKIIITGSGQRSAEKRDSFTIALRSVRLGWLQHRPFGISQIAWQAASVASILRPGSVSPYRLSFELFAKPAELTPCQRVKSNRLISLNLVLGQTLTLVA